MPTDTTLGTFDGILASCPEDVGCIARALRALVIRLDANAHEVPRLGEKAATYGIGSSKMKQAYCYIMPQKKYVNLGFFHGAVLPDPAGLLEGTGKLLRHVKLRTLQDVERPEVRELVRHAIEDRNKAG